MQAYEIALDMRKGAGRIERTVTVRRGDAGTQRVIASITSGGAPYSPRGAARLDVLHADGTWARAAAELSGSTASCTLTGEALNGVGRCRAAHFVFADGEGVESTEGFALVILPDVDVSGTPGAQGYEDELEAMKAAWREFAAGAAEAESARAAAEGTRAEAESDRASAESARAAAERARASSEASRARAEASRSEAESERRSAEEARRSEERSRGEAFLRAMSAAESARLAEQARAEAESARAEAQARNDADQALNNEAVKRLEPVVLGEGQFDRETLRPTVAGEPNRMYFVPMVGTEAGGASSNSFAEWMFVGGGWELMGETEIRARPLSTADVDAVASGSSPQGDGVLTLTGLSYLWARLAGAFAALSHGHTADQVAGLKEALDAKQPSGDYAAASHTHAASDVEGLPALVSGLAGAGPRVYVSPAAHPEVDPDGGWRIPVPASGPLRELASRPGGDVVLFSSGLAMFASPGGWPRHVGMERPVPGCRAAFRCSGSGSGGNGGSLSVEDGGVVAGFAARALSMRVHGVKVGSAPLPPLEVSRPVGALRLAPAEFTVPSGDRPERFAGACTLEFEMLGGPGDTHVSTPSSESGLRGIPFSGGGHRVNIPWEVTGGLLEVEFGPAR